MSQSGASGGTGGVRRCRGRRTGARGRGVTRSGRRLAAEGVRDRRSVEPVDRRASANVRGPPAAGGTDRFGTRTVVIPAARPAFSPFSESSTTSDRRGFDAEPARGLEEDVRRRLAVGDLVGRDDGPEDVRQPGGRERRVDDPPMRRRREGRRPRGGDPADAPRRRRRSSGGALAGVARDHRRRRSRARSSVGGRSRSSRSPHRLRPLPGVRAHDRVAVVDASSPAVLGREVAPDLVPPDLGVDDHAVEIEDHGLGSSSAPSPSPDRSAPLAFGARLRAVDVGFGGGSAVALGRLRRAGRGRAAGRASRCLRRRRRAGVRRVGPTSPSRPAAAGRRSPR